jgi:hypothetical protein
MVLNHQPAMRLPNFIRGRRRQNAQRFIVGHRAILLGLNALKASGGCTCHIWGDGAYTISNMSSNQAFRAAQTWRLCVTPITRRLNNPPPDDKVILFVFEEGPK